MSGHDIISKTEENMSLLDFSDLFGKFRRVEQTEAGTQVFTFLITKLINNHLELGRKRGNASSSCRK